MPLIKKAINFNSISKKMKMTKGTKKVYLLFYRECKKKEKMLKKFGAK